MQLAQALATLGLDPADPAARRLYRELAPQSGRQPAPEDWRTLAAAVARSLMPGRRHRAAPWPAWDQVAPPMVIGLSGGQGAGKSTLAQLLGRALVSAGARAAACSIDDFYLPRQQRQDLARSVHPLLATRGVPGTHRMDLLERVIAGLGGTGLVDLPVFDKGADEPRPVTDWRRIDGPLDALVLEGWCVGARPQPEADLMDPVNDLEAKEDPAGQWRRYVNDALKGPYAASWERLDALIYLEVPDLAAVRRWRAEQERSLRPEQRMSGEALSRFVAHYQRITEWMLADLPDRAPLVVRLDRGHRVTEVHRNPPA